MDRLLCGDVGYGKTEVAMRAAFKALGDGKQVAVLAPTTVLAFQHFETFKRRFAAFPVRIEMFQPFPLAKEMKAECWKTWPQAKWMSPSARIACFRRTSSSRDLGLLIVDEEQRFGVRHKERLKQIKHNVDVLTMSATPIPRTLHMSLLGIARHVRDRDAAQGSPGDPHRGRAFRSRADQAPPSSRSSRAAARFTSFTIASIRIFMRAASIQELVPQRAHRRGPRADGRGGAGKACCSASCGTNTTCSSAPRSSKTASIFRSPTP